MCQGYLYIRVEKCSPNCYRHSCIRNVLQKNPQNRIPVLIHLRNTVWYQLFKVLLSGNQFNVALFLVPSIVLDKVCGWAFLTNARASLKGRSTCVCVHRALPRRKRGCETPAASVKCLVKEFLFWECISKNQWQVRNTKSKESITLQGFLKT